MGNPCKCGLGRNCYSCPHYNLAICFPLIALEWHPDNELSPTDYSPGSGQVVKWLCLQEHCGCHIWEVAINHRTSHGNGCPFHSGRRKCIHTSIFATNPEILCEWDYDNNPGIDPMVVAPGSHLVIWWKCKNDPCGCHRWPARVGHRILDHSGCPFCTRQRSCPHDNFLIAYPEIARSWDYERNTKRPEDYLSYSNNRVWWICLTNPQHRWPASIYNRTGRKSGCPDCAPYMPSHGEMAIINYLDRNNIRYEDQKTFENLRYIRRLRYDFWLPTYNLMIEFDGIQHYEPVPFHGGIEGLVRRRIRDKLKNIYCTTNKFNLLRIHHTDFHHINNIMNETLGLILEGVPIFIINELDQDLSPELLALRDPLLLASDDVNPQFPILNPQLPSANLQLSSSNSSTINPQPLLLNSNIINLQLPLINPNIVNTQFPTLNSNIINSQSLLSNSNTTNSQLLIPNPINHNLKLSSINSNIINLQLSPSNTINPQLPPKASNLQTRILIIPPIVVKPQSMTLSLTKDRK
jgi:hypothetical protein